MVGDRGSDGRINARSVAHPVIRTDPARSPSGAPAGRSGEWIIEVFRQQHHRDLDSSEETPSRAFRLEIVALAATMLDKITVPDCSRTLATAWCVHDAGQIVAGLPIESDLHIDDKHCVHEGRKAA
jgi:hypothetical protein